MEGKRRKGMEAVNKRKGRGWKEGRKTKEG